MSDNPLSPARGILIGLVLGALLWAGAIFTATWLIGRSAEEVVQRCGIDLYHTPALGNVVRCP